MARLRSAKTCTAAIAKASAGRALLASTSSLACTKGRVSSLLSCAGSQHLVLIQLVKRYAHAGSLYYSDDSYAYTRLAVKGNHVVIAKDNGVPRAKGRDHINGIEGFWSFSKNWLYQYRGIPQHHFPLCLKETECRFNH